MSQEQATRFRRSADKVRMVPWINLVITVAAAIIFGEKQPLIAWSVAIVWWAAIAGIAYRWAARIDRRGNRIAPPLGLFADADRRGTDRRSGR